MYFRINADYFTSVKFSRKRHKALTWVIEVWLEWHSDLGAVSKRLETSQVVAIRPIGGWKSIFLQKNIGLLAPLNSSGRCC